MSEGIKENEFKRAYKMRFWYILVVPFKISNFILQSASSSSLPTRYDWQSSPLFSPTPPLQTNDFFAP